MIHRKFVRTFGAPGEHSHAFESPYHLHRHPTPAGGGATPIALYKSDASIAATLAAFPADIPFHPLDAA